MEMEIQDAQDAQDLSATITDQNAVQTRELQALSSRAAVGVCGFPLCNPHISIKWATHNPRPLNKMKVATLVKNIEMYGLLNTDADCLIRIALKREWLDGDLP